MYIWVMSLWTLLVAVPLTKSCPLYNFKAFQDNYMNETAYKYLAPYVGVQNARSITLAYVYFYLCPFELCE